MTNDTSVMPEWWARFEAKFTVQPDGCWQWHAASVPQGYGHMGMRGKVEYSHRISYRHFKGAIPEGLEIDHLCRNRKCCNPDHLEAVTHAENKARQKQARLDAEARR